MKKCNVHLKRLPQQISKEAFVKVDGNYEISSAKILKFEQIKMEEHESSDDKIYAFNVS